MTEYKITLTEEQIASLREVQNATEPGDEYRHAARERAAAARALREAAEAAARVLDCASYLWLDDRAKRAELEAGDDAPVNAKPDQAPVDPQDATGPQEGAGRIGWLRLAPTYYSRHLVREVEGGWSGSKNQGQDAPVWIATDWPNAVFTPLLPGFFVAPDGDGMPAIWHETDDGPVGAMHRAPYNADFFDAVAGLLETREEA